jgi:hypothetical protein
MNLMKRANSFVRIALAIGICLSAASGRSDQGTLRKDSTQSVDQDYQRSKDAAVALGAKEYEEALTNPPPYEIPLPNFNGGPGLPKPMGINSYERDKRYPSYLLCTYDVSEKHYDESNEPAWFEAALRQIRSYGPRRFPPIEWVAVIIRNNAELKGVSTYDQAHKVGAIFRASDVFDLSRDISQLIAHAEMDRHPFVYDPKKESPRDQERWVIVERHAAAERKGLAK